MVFHYVKFTIEELKKRERTLDKKYFLFFITFILFNIATIHSGLTVHSYPHHPWPSLVRDGRGHGPHVIHCDKEKYGDPRTCLACYDGHEAGHAHMGLVWWGSCYDYCFRQQNINPDEYQTCRQNCHRTYQQCMHPR